MVQAKHVLFVINVLLLQPRRWRTEDRFSSFRVDSVGLLDRDYESTYWNWYKSGMITLDDALD